MSSRTQAQYFVPTDGGPKIILLNLQGTLTTTFSEMGPNPRPRPERIMEKEQYWQVLVEWLRQVQELGWEVHLFTVRKEESRDATLESLREKTGWVPDRSTPGSGLLSLGAARTSSGLTLSG